MTLRVNHMGRSIRRNTGPFAAGVRLLAYPKLRYTCVKEPLLTVREGMRHCLSRSDWSFMLKQTPAMVQEGVRSSSKCFVLGFALVMSAQAYESNNAAECLVWMVSKVVVILASWTRVDLIITFHPSPSTEDFPFFREILEQRFIETWGHVVIHASDWR